MRLRYYLLPLLFSIHSVSYSQLQAKSFGLSSAYNSQTSRKTEWKFINHYFFLDLNLNGWDFDQSYGGGGSLFFCSGFPRLGISYYTNQYQKLNEDFSDPHTDPFKHEMNYYSREIKLIIPVFYLTN
jgi:hypothetical protein